PITPAARRRQSGIGHRYVARADSDFHPATPGHAQPTAGECPRFPSLDRLGLCDPDRLPLSLDRHTAGPRTVAPSPTAQSGKSSSSDRATDRDGSDRRPPAAVRILITGTAACLLAGSSARLAAVCSFAVPASPAGIWFSCSLYA